MQASYSAAKDDIVEGVSSEDDAAPSGWACAFWSIFEHQERDIVPVPSSDAQSFPEVDYDKYPTNLYKQIEAKNWTAVNHFLLTGYWSGSFFADSTAPREQACTWVTKYEPVPGTRKKRMVWTHLPIHAALTHGAPQGTISLLVKMAPPTLRCADDFRMLPLHLAFRRGCPDATVALIMNVFPEGVAVRDQIGRTPTECAKESPNQDRGVIISTVLQYNQRAWEKKAAKAQDEQMQTVKKTLQQRNDRISHLKTAIDLIRSREHQTQESFHLVMAELRKFKEWYNEQEDNLSAEEAELRADVVKELSAKLDELSGTAEVLHKKEKKNQHTSNKTLKDLNAAWGDDAGLDDVKFRNFDELMKIHTQVTGDEDEASVEKPTEKVEPQAETEKDEPKAEAEEAEPKAETEKAEAPAEAEKAEPKVEAEEAEKPQAPKEVAKEEPKVAEDEDEASIDKNKEVPHVVSASLESAEQDDGINHVISDMTSLDGMSESNSSLKAKLKSLKKGLKKSLSKKSLNSKSKKADAAAKDPTIKCPAEKRSKNSALSLLGGGDKTKVSPVTQLQLDGPTTAAISAM